jgi:maleylacetoacetate isomerase
MSKPVLYGYYRSSAAYRVRIALNLKRIDYQSAPVQLAKGEHSGAAYLARNPQGMVPALEIDGHLLAQSQAIIEYLDETRPEPPLLPKDAAGRAEARRLAQMIVADIHPINNLRILNYLRQELRQDDAAVTAWMHRWMIAGFTALEQAVGGRGPYIFGSYPGLVECCLVPQLYNARRFNLDLGDFPTLTAIESRCLALPEFEKAHPDRQEDNPINVKPSD